MSNVLRVMRERRSVSKFLDREIEMEKIDQMLESASWAPSSCNSQPWYFLVFNSPTGKRKLKEYVSEGYDLTLQHLRQRHPIMGGIYCAALEKFKRYGQFDVAPAYILVFSQGYNHPILQPILKVADEREISSVADESARTSCAMAVQNLLLASHELGLSTRVKDGIKFMANFPELRSRFYQEFELDERFALITGVQIGYAAEDYTRTPPKRRSIDEIRKIV